MCFKLSGLTDSYAFWKSTKQVDKNSPFFFYLFIKLNNVKIWVEVLWFFWNPALAGNKTILLWSFFYIVLSNIVQKSFRKDSLIRLYHCSCFDHPFYPFVYWTNYSLVPRGRIVNRFHIVIKQSLYMFSHVPIRILYHFVCYIV